MWRRVASQSPSAANPKDDSDAYLNAWNALGKMLALGKSLSGAERNCCFLNLGGRSFANVSAASGFDLPADGRGLAVVDWNDDGKLDVWLTNRTAPRLQFLKNECPNTNRSVTIGLQGQDCNRDAIGARVVVVDAGDVSRKLLKSLKAGEGYLSQSSKWLHFGLGPSAERVHVKVSWPNGTSDVFKNLRVDRKYVIEQAGQAIPQVRRTVRLDRRDDVEPPVASASKRIVLPARFPMPRVEFKRFDAGTGIINFGKRPVLINVWATWCQPCLSEINEWTRHSNELNQLADLLLLSADDVTSTHLAEQKVQSVLSRLGSQFESGLATNVTMETLDVIQQLTSRRIRPLAAPTSFLVDANGNLAIVYKGGVSWEVLKSDLRTVGQNVNQRDLAVPFAGSWYTNPFPADFMSLAGAFFERGKLDASLSYLKNCSPQILEGSLGSTATSQASQLLVDLGMEFQRLGKTDQVVDALEAATRLSPDSFKSRIALVMIHQQAGRHDQVVLQHRKLLEIKPNDVVLTNNLAWVLATCPDENVRSPQEALGLAKEVCARTKNKLPSALDTLAAAHAAVGDFDDAIQIATRAIHLFNQANDKRAVARMQKRLNRYKNKRPFVDD